MHSTIHSFCNREGQFYPSMQYLLHLFNFLAGSMRYRSILRTTYRYKNPLYVSIVPAVPTGRGNLRSVLCNIIDSWMKFHNCQIITSFFQSYFMHTPASEQLQNESLNTLFSSFRANTYTTVFPANMSKGREVIQNIINFRKIPDSLGNYDNCRSLSIKCPT